MKRQYSLATVEHEVGALPAAWQLHTVGVEGELTEEFHISDGLSLVSRVNTGAWEHP